MKYKNEFTDVVKPAAKAPGYSVVSPNLAAIAATGLPELVRGWCVWRAVPDENRPKPQKVPYGADGRPLKVSEPETWISFEQASNLYSTGGWDGVGLLMTAVSAIQELCGIDLDKCLDESGAVLPEKAELVAGFADLGGYVEISPSGRGLRQFLDGTRVEGYLQKTAAWDLEIYDQDDIRYLTVTGRVWPAGSAAGPVVGAPGVANNQALLDTFIKAWCQKEAPPPPLEFNPEDFEGVDRNAEEVLALLKRNNRRGKITRLLAGDCGDYSGDHSAADAALCEYIAFYSRNPVTIDAVFRQSKLIREKWDQRRGRETYGQKTIRKALAWQTKLYDVEARTGEAAKKYDDGRKEALISRGAENLVGGMADLMGAGGKSLRKDTYACSELLIRDKRLQGLCYYDEFSGYVIFSRQLDSALNDKAAPRSGGRMNDAHLLALVRWFGREWGVDIKPDQVGWAIQCWAQTTSINPVKNRFDELASRWDQKPRVGGWLVKYCKAKTITEENWNISEYLAAVGQKWLVSVVARAFQPGCKADTILTLEGKQGTRKSSAARALAEAIGADYFSEGFKLGQGKDTEISLRGRLIVEWAEMAGGGKKDRDELKNFVSLQMDSYRQPFGKLTQDFPRTAVFIANTNESGYLSDPTGNRRFWPVTVGRIDLDGLRRDAEQIWGEAVHIYRAWLGGDAACRWWFDDDDQRDSRVLAMAEAEQRRRVGGTFWGELAAELADRLVLGTLTTTELGNIREARPHQSFSVDTMKAWLSSKNGGGEVEITDSNWYRVCEGLRLAGWESRKSNGRMKWRLTDERREALKGLHGYHDQPCAGHFKLMKARAAEMAGAGAA